MYKVIYLTGAPASGKSSLGHYLKSILSNDLLFFEYGKELMKYINTKNSTDLSQETLREQSSKLVTPADVRALDEILINTVNTYRHSKHIIIDTHAVTKEYYGFRVTPFSLEQLTLLSLTHIYVLFATSETTIQRINDNSMGRPNLTDFQANAHTFFQASVAINYAINLGISVYFFDTNLPKSELYQMIIKKIQD